MEGLRLYYERWRTRWKVRKIKQMRTMGKGGSKFWTFSDNVIIERHLSNSIKFQIFQRCFQNVQLFPIAGMEYT